MEKYAHFDDYVLRYSDCDFADKIKPSALLTFTQESACLSADELGFGYNDIMPNNLAFITVATHCKFLKPVVYGDKLKIETWPQPPRRFFMERSYRVSANDELAALVASRWCLVDFKTFSLQLPEKLGRAHEKCPYRDEKSLETDFKIPKVHNGVKVKEREAVLSDCDHYFHVNNTRYLDYFFDCFTQEELSRPVDEFRISYLKQTKAGSILEFFREDTAEGSLLEARCGGEAVSRFVVTFCKG